MKWLIKHKDTVTSYCGITSGIIVAGFTIGQTYSIAIPIIAQWALGGVLAISIGIHGYLTGKRVPLLEQEDKA